MRELLSLVPRPGRYLGIEEGAVRPEEKERGVLRCALAFPDLYEVGMSYLGQKILYGILNDLPDMLAERVFAPCRETAALLRARGAPLTTLESDLPLRGCDLIGFSITHELCYTNVLYMLDLAGIPLYSAQRAGGGWPLVLAGGGCTLAAEPLAPFMDAMVLGEGEQAIVEIARALRDAIDRGTGRPDLARVLARIPGVYVPELFQPDGEGIMRPASADLPRPTRRIVADLNDAPYPARQVAPFGAVHNRLSLEIARGCTRGCRFCQAGMLCRPVRERDVSVLAGQLDDCLRATGFDEVSFLSLSTGDFSGLRRLFALTGERCAGEQVALSLPSLRVGSVDNEIMERLAGIRRTGVTLAPEAGSQRLRDSINKGVTEEALLDHVRRLAACGWQQVKLYFMIGLPGETDADIEAIIALAGKVRDAARPGARLQVTVSLSPFVPKAHTPFQWEAQISVDEMRRRVELARTRARGEKAIKLRWHEPEMSFLEGVLSRGDRNLAPALVSAFREGGIFASWMEGFSLDPWMRAFAAHGIDPLAYAGARDPRHPLPWDHLESGLSGRFLLEERARALRGAPSPDCRYNACLRCGVCDRPDEPGRVATGGDRRATDVRPRLNFAVRDQETPVLSPLSPVSPAAPPPARPAARAARAKPAGTDPRLAVKAVRYRIWHEKSGPAAFISQHELLPLLERAMRRAALPLAFSQGFHPLPLISFGRALPVGMESLAEWFLLTLHAPLAGNDVMRALGPRMPPGMRLLRIEAMPVHGKIAVAPRERFLLLAPADAAETFAPAWKNVMDSTGFIVTRATDQGEKRTQARAMLEACAVVDNPQGAIALELILNWSQGYMSPLALVRAVTPAIGPERLRLIKLEQFLPDRESVRPASEGSADLFP